MKHVAALLTSLCPVTDAIAQWSTPVPVANINSPSPDFDPSPTFDGRSLYMSSSLPGNYELYRATRTGPYGTFGAATQIMELTSTGTDAGPWPRLDDLELFFYSTRTGGSGGLDLWKADRGSTALPFNAPVPVTELNTASSDVSPCFTVDALRIYFSSTRPGGLGNYDIWTATRPNWSSPFGTPTPVTELNTPNQELDAHVTPDGLVIFFSSDRPGGLSFDTWMASRLDTGSPFGPAVNVTALNASAAEFAPGFAFFYDEMFFTSSRPGGPGGSDIHVSRFTGLIGVGIASAGSQRSLRFSDPSSVGRIYVAASSLGQSPGIRIDSRVLPLNFDLLLQLSIGGLPPILTGYVGALDQDGIGSGSINFAGFPQMRGLKFSTAFVVLDPQAISGIKTISNAEEVVVQ
jgi:hypothetical protein